MALCSFLSVFFLCFRSLHLPFLRVAVVRFISLQSVIACDCLSAFTSQTDTTIQLKMYGKIPLFAVAAAAQLKHNIRTVTLYSWVSHWLHLIDKSAHVSRCTPSNLNSVTLLFLARVCVRSVALTLATVSRCVFESRFQFPFQFINPNSSRDTTSDELYWLSMDCVNWVNGWSRQWHSHECNCNAMRTLQMRIWSLCH